jgi:hypothetical protein
MALPKHVKVYLQYFDIGESDIWFCEACTKELPIRELVIHHIHGRGQNKDVIKNLMCLCPLKCHPRAHSSKNYVSKDEFQLIHNNFLQGNRKRFLK